MKKLFLILIFCSVGLAGFSQIVSDRDPHNVPNSQIAPPPNRTNEIPGGEGQQEPGKEPLKLFIPNAFTPNSDGINDEYYINNSRFQQFEFLVFDRWGNMILNESNPEFRWNGRVNNRLVSAGIYVYVFNGTTSDGIQIRRSGTISVIY